MSVTFKDLMGVKTNWNDLVPTINNLIMNASFAEGAFDFSFVLGDTVFSATEEMSALEARDDFYLLHPDLLVEGAACLVDRVFTSEPKLGEPLQDFYIWNGTEWQLIAQKDESVPYFPPDPNAPQPCTCVDGCPVCKGG